MYGFLYVADKYEGLVIVGNPDSEEQESGCRDSAGRKSGEQFSQTRVGLQSAEC